MFDRGNQKRKLCDQVVQRSKDMFDLSEMETSYLRTRLKAYDKVELQHLYQNFNTFGFDAVLECIYGSGQMKKSKK